MPLSRPLPERMAAFVAVADEVYSLGGFVDDAGSFEACTIDPPDADVDYDVVGSSVRGEGTLEEVDPVGTYVRNEDPVEVEVTFDITCA
jgi:hypothetical protein